MNYYSVDSGGNITAFSTTPRAWLPLSTDKDIVRGFDGMLYFDDDVPQVPLDTIKKAKRVEVNSKFETAVNSVTAGYPSSELLTFDKQETEARAYVANNTAPTPMLSALAAARGMALSELVTRVIVKADAFEVAVGNLVGQRQKYEDTLEAALTAEQVDAIVVNYT